MGAPSYMVATSIHAVLAQRLVRTNCESCIQPYKMSAQEAAWLESQVVALPGDARLMHGRGCSHCNGSGYAGRIGVYEMLEMTRELVEAATRNDPTAFARAAQAQLGGDTLAGNAVKLVLEGRTTVQEAMQVAAMFD
jgi:MSHA biogenesis protein MshE